MMLRQRHTGRQTRDELVGLLADSGGESRARGDAKKAVWRNPLVVLGLALGAVWMTYLSLTHMWSGRLSNDSYYLLHNARIHTVDASIPFADSVVIKKGRFLDVGKADDLKRKHPDAKKVDLRGRMVVPGLIDAHGHLIEQGLALLQADITGSPSLTQVRDHLKSYLKSHPEIVQEKDWLMGKGWDQTKWPETNHQFPTFSDLDIDPLLASVPICLYRIDYHAYWLNGAALERVRPFVPEGDVEGGEIVRDGKGRLTGIFVDNAMEIVERALPRPSERRLGEAIKEVTGKMVEFGLTGMHDAGVAPWQIEVMKRAIDAGEFPIRNYAMIRCPDPLKYCGDLVAHVHDYGDKLTVRSVKLFLDGAVGSWGAAMIEPYSDDPSKKGFLRMPEADVADLVWEWMENDYQVNIHCIGDLANKIALDAFEKCFERAGKNETDYRMRVEHAQIVREEDIPRFARLRITPSMQPTHATSDMTYVEKRIGLKRVKGAYAWRSFLDASVEHLPLGSDFPIEGINPLLGIYAAVTRLDVNGSSPHGPSGWYPNQKLTRFQALKGFTLDAAWAAFQENELGSITPNKRADFTVFDRDFMDENVDAREILGAKVVATVVGGEVVFGVLE